jgi:5-formyltetrahydrofolate cyclo-ligase
MTDLPSPDLLKQTLRRSARARRKQACAALGAEAGMRIAEAFLAAFDGTAGRVVAGYWPMEDEADIRPLLVRLAERGCRIALPVVQRRDAPLIFRRWQPGDPLEEGLYRTQHPSAAAAEVDPDLFLVPLLAFDRGGRRLGYGGGYYDRTLAALRARGTVLAVGVAFAAQQVDLLPDGSFDQRLDWVVTENGAWKAVA